MRWFGLGHESLLQYSSTSSYARPLSTAQLSSPNMSIPCAIDPAPPHRLPAGLWVPIRGGDAMQREHLQRLSRLLLLSAFSCSLLWVGAYLGLTTLWAASVISGYCALGVGTLAVLIRSGTSKRWADPALSYAQLMVAISAVVLAYGLVEMARTAALQLLCLLLAFGMDRLTRAQLLRASLWAVVMLCGVSLLRWIFTPEQMHLQVELYNLVMVAVLLPSAILIGGEVGRLHRRLSAQRSDLSGLLTQLDGLSATDALTGLTNRRRMMSLLDEEVARQQRTGQPFSVAILDIDWFKRVNDSGGHALGDTVLQEFSGAALSALRQTDTLARWGGEEFLLLMPDCDESRALALLQRVHQAVANCKALTLMLPAVGGNSADAARTAITFSAGIAQHANSDAIAHTLDQADLALYRAKQAGRNRSVTRQNNPLGGASSALDGDDFLGDTQCELRSAAAQVQSETHVTAALSASSCGEGADTADAPAPPTGRAPRTLWRVGVDLVMGTNPSIRERLRLPMLAFGLHFIWILVVLLYALPQQHVQAFDAKVAVLYDCTTVLVFYSLIRSGLSARWRDPVLVLPQMLVACAVVSYSYTVAPMLRPSLLHLVCVIQVFGMVTLTPSSSRIAGASAVLMLLMALLAMQWSGSPGMYMEMLNIALSCFILVSLAMLAHQYSMVRVNVESEKELLADAVERMRELVVRDALTGLFNRKHMQDLLRQECERFARSGQGFCVALIDLDHFKRVNDVYGHQMGDVVLAGVARAAQGALRANDVICRWGGEEFLVLLRDNNPAHEGLQAMARLRRQVTELRPAPSAPDLRVTFSAGLAVSQPGEAIMQMLERADRALYAAKSGGRNQDALAAQVIGTR
jgi:diguanylate cyclase